MPPAIEVANAVVTASLVEGSEKAFTTLVAASAVIVKDNVPVTSATGASVGGGVGSGVGAGVCGAEVGSGVGAEVAGVAAGVAAGVVGFCVADTSSSALSPPHPWIVRIAA
jgi:hypothetical protein